MFYLKPPRHTSTLPKTRLGLYVRFWRILLQKSFWGDERTFLEPLTRFTRGDVRGPYRCVQNRSGTSVIALKCGTAAEKSKYHFSRDF